MQEKMYKVVAYNRYSLGGYQEYYYRTEEKARERRVDLLVRLPEEYVVHIMKVDIRELKEV